MVICAANRLHFGVFSAISLAEMASEIQQMGRRMHLCPSFIDVRTSAGRQVEAELRRTDKERSGTASRPLIENRNV